MTFLRVALLGLWVASAGVPALAQIKIGQTVGVTGAVAATVKESSFGAQLYIDSINAKELIETKGVLALFMTRGTPHTEGIIPLLDQHGVPLLAPSTGAMVLHQP